MKKGSTFWFLVISFDFVTSVFLEDEDLHCYQSITLIINSTIRMDTEVYGEENLASEQEQLDDRITYYAFNKKLPLRKNRKGKWKPVPVPAPCAVCFSQILCEATLRLLADEDETVTRIPQWLLERLLTWAED